MTAWFSMVGAFALIGTALGFFYAIFAGRIFGPWNVTRENNPLYYWYSVVGYIASFIFILFWLNGVSGFFNLSQASDFKFGGLTVSPSNKTESACPLATDADYGYSDTSPILIGGGEDKGPARAKEFVNNLLTLNQEPIAIGRYNYILTTNATLHFYEITIAGTRHLLYFDYFSYATPQAPLGLICATRLTFTGP